MSQDIMIIGLVGNRTWSRPAVGGVISAVIPSRVIQRQWILEQHGIIQVVAVELQARIKNVELTWLCNAND